MRRIVQAAALSLALYCFAAWVYVAISAIVVPQTLHLPLWHLTHWPRQDTFGAACFLVSMVSFFTWQVLRLDRS